MSKYQALIDALKAGPTSAVYTHPRDDNKWKENDAFARACEPATIRSLLADLEMAEKALQSVVDWGPFPRVPDEHSDEPGATISYGVAYGSNGQRDYIRAIARAALSQIAGGGEQA